MIALPTAVQQSGVFFGFVACTFVAIISTLAAIALSDCWCILLRLAFLAGVLFFNKKNAC
jgi:hypothetical protein